MLFHEPYRLNQSNKIKTDYYYIQFRITTLFSSLINGSHVVYGISVELHEPGFTSIMTAMTVKYRHFK